jgi:hypothetical protein
MAMDRAPAIDRSHPSRRRFMQITGAGAASAGLLNAGLFTQGSALKVQGFKVLTTGNYRLEEAWFSA